MNTETQSKPTAFRGSLEFMEAMDMFERVLHKSSIRAKADPGSRAKRKPDGTWPSYFYDDGLASHLFEMFLQGMVYGKAIAISDQVTPPSGERSER